MIAVILFFLLVSVLFYVLFGGADFGAGILELWIGKEKRLEQQKLISRAMAPVWEANHVWLILAVVILFMGFPIVYSAISTYLHLPVIAVLLGIVARGTAFTFRHYDTLTTQYYRAYSRVFAWSSLWTSFFLGVLAGALYLGRIRPDAGTFGELYVEPWFNLFCAAVGVFACMLFSFLAAIYLTGEAAAQGDEPVRAKFESMAIRANVGAVAAGAAVFAIGEVEGAGLIGEFFSEPVAVACFAVATLLLFPFWRTVRRTRQVTLGRVIAVAIVSLVLLGAWSVQYPAAFRYTVGGILKHAEFAEAAAPEATLRALLWALVIGSLLIFPALGYLLKVFKWETLERRRL